MPLAFAETFLMRTTAQRVQKEFAVYNTIHS